MILDPPTTGLDRVFRVDARVGPVEDYGITRAGHRRVVPILGGTVSGEVEAELLPGGADWQLVAPDGRLEIDTRYSARTRDGELLHLRTHGIRTGPADVLEAVLRGDAVGADAYSFRVVVTVETSAPRFAHLQDSLLVAAAARGADRVVYDAYRVR